RGLVALAALCGTVVLAGWVAAGLGFRSLRIENTGAATGVGWAMTVDSEPIDGPQATAMGEVGVSVTDVAIVDAALPDPRRLTRSETPSATPDPVHGQMKETGSSAEKRDECLGDASCIDRYLWSLYERTPKVDTIKVPERI